MGPLRLGMRDAELAALGLQANGSQGSASFVQDGAPRPITFRVSGTWTLAQDGQPQVVADVDPAQMRVASLRAVGPVPTTAEGVGVGTTLERVRAVYGEPEHSWQPAGFVVCAQFAARPGIDVCFRAAAMDPTWKELAPQAVVTELRVPASRSSPLALGEDLAAIAATLEGHLIDGGMVDGAARVRLDGAREPFELIAPCLLLLRSAPGEPAGWSYRNVVARGGAVYEVAGGWRGAGGELLVCDSGGVFMRAADGTSVRWKVDPDRRWRPEPATCEVREAFLPPRVVCKGTTDPFGFDGELAGELVVAKQYADGLAARKAVHRDRRAGPFTAEGQCQFAAERTWDEMVPALAFAGAPTDAVARLHYLQKSREKVVRCASQPLAQRLCTAMTPVMLEADRACSPAALVSAWSDAVREPMPKPRPPTASEAKQRGAALTGTWSKRAGQPPVRWTISAKGERLRIEGGADEGEYALSPAPEGWWVARRPLRELPIEVAFVDADRFYEVDARMSRLVDRRHFDVRLSPGSDALLMRGEVCNSVTAAGQLRAARCRFVTEDGGERLEVEYTDSERGATTTRFVVVDGFYLAPQELEPPLPLFERER